MESKPQLEKIPAIISLLAFILVIILFLSPPEICSLFVGIFALFISPLFLYEGIKNKKENFIIGGTLYLILAVILNIKHYF